MPEAATNCPVWITIHGTRGSINNKYLEIAENESFPFEPDNKDLFILYDTDIGEVRRNKHPLKFNREKRRLLLD
jgi:hypothetical protein